MLPAKSLATPCIGCTHWERLEIPQCRQDQEVAFFLVEKICTPEILIQESDYVIVGQWCPLMQSVVLYQPAH